MIQENAWMIFNIKYLLITPFWHLKDRLVKYSLIREKLSKEQFLREKFEQIFCHGKNPKPEIWIV